MQRRAHFPLALTPGLPLSWHHSLMKEVALMLQQRELNQEIIPALINTYADTSQSLEQRVNNAIGKLRSERKQQSQQKSMLTRWAVTLDELIRTDEPEFLDRSDYDDAKKVEIVARLNRFNRSVQAYWRFLSILKPYIQHVHKKENRRVNILELASGSGDFTLALAERAHKQKLPIHIFGSDYIEAHVQEGNSKAQERGIAVQFKKINAFDMHNVAPGEFDIIFIAQTMHHFTPGQLAKLVAQASEKVTYAMIGIDGHRGVDLFAILPAMLMINPHYGFMHDSVISMRKMYSEPELELIAHCAAPRCQARAFSALPGYSVLEVLKDY